MESETRIKNLTVVTQPHPDSDELVVGLKGAVDSYNAEDLKTTLKKITAEGHTRIVFDCAALSYVSSIGIGVFMNLLSEIKKAKGSVVFAAVPDAIARIFDNLGFTVFFSFREKV
jgi:anti-sigma B factor antagonist